MTAKQKQQKQEEFLTLRITGASFDAIAKELNVSKRTLIAWARIFKDEIDQARQAAVIDALEAGKHTKEERIKKALSMLNSIEDSIDERLKAGDDSLKDLMQARETFRAEIDSLTRSSNAAGENLQDSQGDEVVIRVSEIL